MKRFSSLVARYAEEGFLVTNDGRLNRLFVDYYYQFKRQQGSSPL